MTSNLRCPFCQKGLSQGYNHDRDTVFYHCNNCYFQGDGIIWIALIQAKQDLEIVTNALLEICNDYQEDSTERAEKALTQIEHKDK